MAREATGTKLVNADQTISLRFTLAFGVKMTIPLARHKDDPLVDDTAQRVITHARRLYSGGLIDRDALAAALTDVVARYAHLTAPQLEEAWRRTEQHKLVELTIKPSLRGGLPTYREVATRWVTGVLELEHKEAKRRRMHRSDLHYFTEWVFPVFGGVTVDQVKTQHLNAVWAATQGRMRDSTRVYLWKTMVRVMSLCVYPLEYLPAHPIPREACPTVEDRLEKQILYPRDELQLMQCADIPVHDRMLYGVLAREGMRVGEALSLVWGNLDDQGVLSVWQHKTAKLQAWVPEASTLRALRLYREHWCPDATRADRIFAPTQWTTRNAYGFRRWLRVAGLHERRPELFEHGSKRGESARVNLHGLRSLFVTCSIASGRPDSYIRQRTGHRSEAMIDTYTGPADIFRALGTTSLTPLDEAIPELGEKTAKDDELEAAE
jgi:integrase